MFTAVSMVTLGRPGMGCYKGHVNQPIGGKNRSNDKKALQGWTCGGNYSKIDFLQ